MVKRRALNLTAALSLLMLAAWVMLWISYATRQVWGLWSFPHADGSAYPAVMPDRYGVAFAWIEASTLPMQDPSIFNSFLGFHFQRYVANLGPMTDDGRGDPELVRLARVGRATRILGVVAKA